MINTTIFNNITKISAFLALLIACTGCSNQEVSQIQIKPRMAQTDPYGQHGIQEQRSFSQAVKRLIAMNERIRESFAAGDTESAHGTLHQIGHVLEEISELVHQEELPMGQILAVEMARDRLFTAFGNIDKTLHGRKGSTYDDEARLIRAALEFMEDAAGLKVSDSLASSASG